ncbi:MAG TPA: FCD domain-containing protein [Solirubrobacteraceae bacterium]|nr:FCD domain-containing protein [Solirubrobacteraceae bacterium]
MSATPSSDHVSQLLQQAIASRALEPGDRVGTEADLARELNVSRPAVREAVRLLARANLLRAARGPGGGVFVARSPEGGLAQTVSDAITGMLATEATSVGELTEMRLLLEVPLAGLAAEHATPAAIAELVRAVEDAERAPDDDLVQRETDIRFHRAIVEAGGNRVASALAGWSSAVLQPRLKDLIAPAIVEAVAREQHREIIAAIEQRKPVLAERAMRVHLRYLSDLLETVGTPAGR